MTSRINAGVFSSASDDWSTPQDLFDLLDREFHFDLDIAASPDNAKCGRYFSLQDDARLHRWESVTAAFMNPPYSLISTFMQSAHNAAYVGSAAVVCLVPARTDTRWFWNFALPGEIRLLPGRLKFGGGKNSAPFPSCVVVLRRFLPAECARIYAWDYRPLLRPAAGAHLSALASDPS